MTCSGISITLQVCNSIYIPQIHGNSLSLKSHIFRITKIVKSELHSFLGQFQNAPIQFELLSPFSSVYFTLIRGTTLNLLYEDDIKG